MANVSNASSAGVKKLIDDGFNLAINSPEAALPYIDRLSRAFSEAAAEVAENDTQFYDSAIHALRFVAYGRIAAIEFEQTKSPSGRIAGMCEMALKDYRAARDIGWDTSLWSMSLDATATILERCRPGRVHELIGFVKIKHLARCDRVYLPDSFMRAAEAGHVTNQELDSISELELVASSGTIRSAALSEMGSGKYLITLSSNPQPSGPSDMQVVGFMQLERINRA